MVIDMAQIWEYIKIALMNIKSNKGRSVLTMLGIIIGIASVIMVMAIGNGVRGQINEELESMGSGLIELYLDTTGRCDDTLHRGRLRPDQNQRGPCKRSNPRFGRLGTGERGKRKF